MRSRLLAAAFALLPGMFCFAVDAPPAPAAQSAPLTAQEIDLKLVDPAGAYGYYSEMLKDGKGEIAFPNKLSKLKLQYKDGKLWVDSNADGQIDERDNSVVPGDNAKVMAKAMVGGREVELPIVVRSTYENGKDSLSVVMGISAAMEGTVNGSTLRLRFGGFTAEPAPKFNAVQFIPAGTKPEDASTEQFSKTLTLGERLYSAEVLDSGWKLKLTPYTGPVARVTVKFSEPANGCQATLASVEGIQTNTADSRAKSPALFVPGQYGISYIHLAIYDDKGGHQCVSARRDAKAKPITLAEGENTLTFGGPFKLDVTAAKKGDTIEFVDAIATGVAGEKYGPSAQNTNGQLFAAYIRGNGTEQELTKLSYG